MARNRDKSADSTSGELPSANTDALLDPIPEDLSKTVEQSLNMPPPLADDQTDPNRLSEVMDSATIVASSVAIPGDSPTTVEQEMSGLSASGSNAHQSNTAMQVPLVPHPTNDGLPSEVCAAGIECTSPQGPADLSGCIHRCWGCGGRVHSLIFCGMSLERFLCVNPLLIGHQLPNGKIMVEDSDNETRCICHSCITNLSAATMPAATQMDNNHSVQLSKNDGGGAIGNHPIGLSTTDEITTHVSSHRINQRKLPMTGKTYTSSSDTSSDDDSDDSGPTASGSSSLISSRSYYYYPPFTMYRKCNGIRPDDSTQYQTLITKAMDSRSNPSNRIDPWVKIVDKWSRPLPSKSKVPLTTIDDDLYIGDDGLFSQSTFSDGLLADEEHLKSLCPTNPLLPRIFIQNDALPFLVEQLCQAVLHLKSLQNRRESLSILKKKGGKTTINVFRIQASACSLGIIDGAECIVPVLRHHLFL